MPGTRYQLVDTLSHRNAQSGNGRIIPYVPRERAVLRASGEASSGPSTLIVRKNMNNDQPSLELYRESGAGKGSKCPHVKKANQLESRQTHDSDGGVLRADLCVSL